VRDLNHAEVCYGRDRQPTRRFRRAAQLGEASDHRDGSDDGGVEGIEVLGRNPIFQVVAPAGFRTSYLAMKRRATSKRVTKPDPLAGTFQSRAILVA
jgi:hypothetical protein